MCNGAREYTCWNSMTVDAADVAASVAGDIRELVRELPSFDENWFSEYETQRSSLQASLDSELQRAAAELTKGERSLQNLLKALAELGSSPSVLGKIKTEEARAQLLRD